MGLLLSVTSARFVRAAVVLSCFAFFLPAQKDTAGIVGIVIDSSGGAVRAATNFSYNVVTDVTGQYVISPVRVGTYRIFVSAPG